MNIVTVKKDRLLTALQENRETHVDIFDKAQVAYRAAMIEELERGLAEAKAGKKIKRAFNLPLPEEHTDDFDTAIEMIDWEVGDEVELEHQEFEQYVLNKWRWAASFAGNTQSYVAH